MQNGHPMLFNELRTRREIALLCFGDRYMREKNIAYQHVKGHPFRLSCNKISVLNVLRKMDCHSHG